jgi:hypothetical protein
MHHLLSLSVILHIYQVHVDSPGTTNQAKKFIRAAWSVLNARS